MLGVEFNDRMLGLAIDGELAGAAPPRMRVRPSGLGQAIPALLDSLREQMASSHAQPGAMPLWANPMWASPMWASVPAGSSGAELGELLRALRAAKCDVQGFVDAATIAVAWARLPGQSIVLDLQHAWTDLSLVADNGDAFELRRTARVPMGQADLFDHWLRLAAQTLVQQTRFDPLHDQRHERMLRDALPELALQAQAAGQARFDFDVDGRQLELVLSRDQLQLAAAPWYQGLAATLQPLCASAGECNLVVPDSLLGLPGMDEAMAATHAGSLHALAPAASARAASLMAATGAGSTGAVPYLTRVGATLPQAGDAVCRAVQHSERRIGAMATHLVYRGRAIAIPAEGMVLGSATDAGVQLPDGIAGLSRRHCTLQRVGNRTQVIDHSRHGSFVDGLRIRGRGFLAAGSVLRLGTPGIELPLISL